MKNASKRISVHPTAIIHKTASIGQGCVIGPNVYIGESAYIAPYCVIGGVPEHREFYSNPPNKFGVHIEAGARISSFTTIDAGTIRDTFIGQGSVIHNHSHVAHDCQLMPGSLLGGHATLAGDVLLFDGAIVSGKSAVHQHCVVGHYAFVGADSFLNSNVPSGQLWVGSPARPAGNNEVGLSRAGMNYVQCQTKFSEIFLNECNRRKPQ